MSDSLNVKCCYFLYIKTSVKYEDVINVFLSGIQAIEKKAMIKDGALDKYGKPSENTPAKWLQNYTDYNAPEATSKQETGLMSPAGFIKQETNSDPADRKVRLGSI